MPTFCPKCGENKEGPFDKEQKNHPITQEVKINQTTSNSVISSLPANKPFSESERKKM